MGTMPYLTTPCHTSLHHTIPHYTMPYLTTPYHTSLHHAIPHYTKPYLTTPCHTSLHHAIPYAGMLYQGHGWGVESGRKFHYQWEPLLVQCLVWLRKQEIF